LWLAKAVEGEGYAGVWGVLLTWFRRGRSARKVVDGVGVIGGAADATKLWVAAEATRGTGSVKRSYWVLICVMDANRTKP
jgi:hypothetical protein